MILLDRECLVQTIERRARHLFGPEIRYEVRSMLGQFGQIGDSAFQDRSCLLPPSMSKERVGAMMPLACRLWGKGA